MQAPIADRRADRRLKPIPAATVWFERDEEVQARGTGSVFVSHTGPLHKTSLTPSVDFSARSCDRLRDGIEMRHRPEGHEKAASTPNPLAGNVRPATRADIPEPVGLRAAMFDALGVD